MLSGDSDPATRWADDSQAIASRHLFDLRKRDKTTSDMRPQSRKLTNGDMAYDARWRCNISGRARHLAQSFAVASID